MIDLNDIFSKKYNHYLGVATNILSASKFDNKEATSLLSECYIYLVEKNIKGTEDYIDSVVINWMNKQIKWHNTSFQKQIKINDSEINMNHYLEDEEYEEDDFEKRKEWLEKKYIDLDYVGKRLFELAIVGPYNNSGKLSRFLNLNRTTCYYMIRDMKFYLKDGYN